MNSKTVPQSIILPSETQSREFDAKLLLACALAERGLPTFVGSRIAIHNAIHKFPRAIYLAKDFRKPSNRIFRILEGLGQDIVAWDEEAVLFFNAREFHERRVHAPTFAKVKTLFAWGPENADFLRTAPGYNPAVPVFDTGNPRIDMLREDLRTYYAPEVAELKKRYGKFILINSNFGKLNHAVSKYVVRPSGVDRSVGGTITPFMQQAWNHRLEIFESFKALVPALANAMPGYSIIVRPHPAENHQTWQDTAKGIHNVHVLHEGPVQNWLLAAEAMIHNGCTTGIEAYLLDVPTISYQVTTDTRFDLALSNNLGMKASSPDQVVQAISQIAARGPLRTPISEKVGLLGKHFSSLEGTLASDRIASVIASFAETHSTYPAIGLKYRARAILDSRLRAVTKWVAQFIPDHKNGRAYNIQRFPGTTLQEVEIRLQRLRLTLGRFQKIKVSSVSHNIFLIS